MLNKKSVDDINVNGKRVLCRCDFNVPLDGDRITDETRLVAALPTIKKLIADGGKVILCSHLGKPKGPDATFSLAPVAKRLSELLGQEVKFAADDTVVGDNARAAVADMKNGDVILLENTRFRPEETKNGEAFSKDLASICDVFVNDAFGTAHRSHASNVGISEAMKAEGKQAAAGYLLEKEIKFLGNAVDSPKHPFVAILGGAKVSDKIGVINHLLGKADKVIVGGGMTYTFYAAKGIKIGNSLVEKDKIELAKEIMEKAGDKLVLPVDNVCAKEFNNDAPSEVVEGDIPDGYMALDIGPKSVELFEDTLKDAKTVVWNGPMGVFEMSNFAKGTLEVGKFLGTLSDATTIVGGGDSTAAVQQLGVADKLTHISTGGGASLEYLEGKTLPGIAAVSDK